MNAGALRAAYDGIKAEAEQLAGAPSDIPRRVALLHSVFMDSRGNHTFPIVAAHGALWAYGFFETTGKLGRLVQYRYLLNRRERDYRLSLLNGFAQGFKRVNRSVFVDTMTNYHFTRLHGREPGADQLVPPALLAALNGMHAANSAGASLDRGTRRALFEQALRWEQEVTVAPGVRAEIQKFDCPILARLCLMPVVHFAYFPRTRYIFFRNFSDPGERIANAIRSFELAQRCGWSRVVETLRNYGALPEEFFRDPAAFVRGLATETSAEWFMPGTS